MSSLVGDKPRGNNKTSATRLPPLEGLMGVVGKIGKGGRQNGSNSLLAKQVVRRKVSLIQAVFSKKEDAGLA